MVPEEFKKKEGVEQIRFTVDSALLRELGERLVGKPYIALAELIKNSYDADARKVVIRFNEKKIEVEDNGHGMSEEDFRSFWMRIGSTHKARKKRSRFLARPLTGSKGIGRLAVQFLARETELLTSYRESTELEIHALVDWNEAVEAGELTEAFAYWEQGRKTEEFLDESSSGTRIVLTGLKHEWSPDDFKNLAREIWVLQPPFLSGAGRSEAQKSFFVEVETTEKAFREQFQFQMRAFLELWDARVTGRLLPKQDPETTTDREAELRLEFEGGRVVEQRYMIVDCPVDRASFEFRVYKWQGKQRFGIKVQDARDYFNEFGGIYVYDAGFRLPYYGPDHDWLDIERDHSHRRSKSRILPDEFHVPSGLNNLPTTTRLFGVVHVDTNHEREAAEARRKRREEHQQREDEDWEEPYLQIQVTRDRLADNKANQKLQELLRWALDFYAMEETKRKLTEVEERRSDEPASAKFRRVEEVLEHFASSIPQDAYQKLKTGVDEAVRASQSEAEAIAQQVALLAPLATAGMSALAYEHEVGKQIHDLNRIADALDAIPIRDSELRAKLDGLARRIRDWIGRAKATRDLFRHLLEEEDRTAYGRFKVKAILEDVHRQVLVFAPGVEFDFSDLEDDFRLPQGAYMEWIALFQNVLLNSANALIDSDEKRVSVQSDRESDRRFVLVLDTGSGVEIEESAELFKPFARQQELSRERRGLGLGGTGLGLTIVKLIAENTGCSVRFVQPPEDFATAFELSWKENF